MRRTDPPPLATWMLEHCVPADHADALAGDLLEDFHAGRSDAWYWRQTLSACGVAWAEGLRARMPVVLFALLWSMLAPAWKVFVDGLDNSFAFDRVLASFGPLWIVIAFAGWLLLHSLFLWAGILIYYVANASLGRALRRNRVGRAFLVAPLVFAPVCGLAVVWAALYWWSYFANAKLASTPLGQITDLQLLADLTRLPFFVALLCALWNLFPLPARISPSALADSFVGAAPVALTPPVLRRFFAFLVAAGLINAMIAAFVVCRLPASHAPSLQSLLLRAALYVVGSVLAGIAGTYLYWFSPASPFRSGPPIPFKLFALVGASSWVWVPSMAMFYEQLSGFAAPVAGVAALLLAIGLRRAALPILEPATLRATSAGKGFDLFAESLCRPRGEVHGYVIALSLFAAGAALMVHENSVAAILLASGAFLFAWKNTFVSSEQADLSYRQSALRLALVVLPAILVTFWALLDGVAHRNLAQIAGTPPEDHAQVARVDPSDRSQGQPAKAGAGGYESLILWPFPEKKPIVPPIPARTSLLTPGTSQPLIIRFDGPYWYLQPPDKRPGPRAHQAYGTPLSAEIRSINDLPLVMDAHQPLGGSIPINRCGKIEVEIENGDDRSGSIEMAVLLSDASAPGKPELYLGQETIPPSQSKSNAVDLASMTRPSSAMKHPSAVQALEFPIPAATGIRRFNEITVMLLSDGSRDLVGPKIAIRQFQLFPR